MDKYFFIPAGTSEYSIPVPIVKWLVINKKEKVKAKKNSLEKEKYV
jgi:hypothetical protein